MLPVFARSLLFAAGALAVCAAARTAAAQTTSQISVTSTLRPACVFSTDMSFHLELQQHLLPAVGSKGPLVPGTLASSGCAGVTTVKLSFIGDATAEDDSLFAVEPGGAGGVGIEILTDDDRPVVPNDVTPLNFAPANIGESYGFKARFARIGPVTTGETKATITIGFAYD